MKNIIIGFALLFSFSFLMSSCISDTEGKEVVYQCPMKCEGDKVYSENGSCPVCKMDLKKKKNKPNTTEVENDLIPETSIFNLTSKWNTQDNETIELKELKGDVLVVVMVYTSCEAACPRLMADMKRIKAKVKDNSIKYVLVSIDPETDTPKRLREVAKEYEMDSDQWVFLQGTNSTVREFANVLAVKYKKISPLDFSHSNIISVFDKDGVLQHQQEGLGVDNQNTVAKILELTD